MSGSATKDSTMNRPSTRRTARWFSPPAGVLAVAGVFLVALFLPSTAFAIPGAGEFVALDSNNAREITELYNLIGKICLAILIVVEGVLLTAILKFRRQSDDERPRQNHGDLRLEFGWTMGALLIQIWIGVATIDVMFDTETEPDEGFDMTITAEARQWDWTFRYEFDDERGSLTHNDLVIPAHRNVNLQVTSADVLHAVWVPQLGVKIDAVPGRYNHWWFRADGPLAQVRTDDYATLGRPDGERPQTGLGFMSEDRPDASERTTTGLERRVDYLGESREVEEISPYAGYNAVEYQGLCAELCGLDHWNMYFRAVVMTPSSFDRWVEDQLAATDEADGEAIFENRCVTCHGEDGTGIDPNPALAGSPITTDPESQDEHIRQILEGQAAMPAFQRILNDDEVAAVVNYERTSWGNEGGLIEPADVAELRESLGMDPRPATAIEPVATDELMNTGGRLYQSCASCHGADGESFDDSVVPDLAGNDVVVAEEPAELVQILTQGLDTDRYPGQKRPVAAAMGNRELASLLTYIRQSFGNDAGAVQPFDLQEIRDELE